MLEYLFYFFTFCTVVQILFLLVYLITIGFYSRKGKKDVSPISIIVCARNEIENLRQNIPLLLAQDHTNFELIVVNDQSTDGTYEYLLELKKQYSNFKLVQIDTVPDHIQSKKYAITLGIKAASNDKVLLTDADCTPNSTDWASEMTVENSFAIGVSLYNKRRGILNLFIRFETYLTAIQYTGNALLGKPYMGVGRNLGYDKNIFIKNKGFNQIQGVIGGDDDLFVNQHATRKNVEVVLGKKALVFSKPKTSISEFINQKKRHLSVGKYYKFSDKVILSFFSFTYIMFWISGIVIVINEPSIPVPIENFSINSAMEAINSAMERFSIRLVLGGFSIRLVLLTILFYVSSKRFGQRFVPLILPILDFLYVIYYILIGIVTTFSKKIKWN
ncbi:MAG: glycosyltransferase [Cyclobacteriaceae bacterium]|nr:glycosyltransferase [Cyclobacteriaceae bacterium]